VVAGSQRRSFKHNHDLSSTTTNSRRHWSSDFLDSRVDADDACLAKNLLCTAASDDDDDGAAATGRLRPPKVRDCRPPGCPGPSPSTAWQMAAVPAGDCPFCWAHVPPPALVDDCGSADVSAAHRWSTPGIQVTTSPESPPTNAACDCRADDVVAKRRCSSLVDAAQSPAALRRSVPDIARTSVVRGHASPARPPPPLLPPTSGGTDRWLTAGVATLPRPTTVTRADVLPTCLRCPFN